MPSRARGFSSWRSRPGKSELIVGFSGQGMGVSVRSLIQVPGFRGTGLGLFVLA